MTPECPPARSRSRLAAAALTAGLLLALAACGGNDQGPLDVIGSYTTSYGETDVITQLKWTMTYAGSPSVFHILNYSNGLMFLLARNDAANAYNGGLYSRFTWTIRGGQLYYCQDPYDAPSPAAARDARTPETGDPATKGCGSGDFPWTALYRQ